MIDRLRKTFDLQDLQLVAGISSLGYGLYLVYPPAMFIILGLMFIAPIILRPYISTKVVE